MGAMAAALPLAGAAQGLVLIETVHIGHPAAADCTPGGTWPPGP